MPISTANRLINETSPYLLQHAHNPVDWYPWGEEALKKAKEDNKPILVSIGYSACHWCHVMEKESFEDVDIAEIMNNHFICIKIDREERPDLDAIYMDAVQAITGSGGWPLNVFLTPDGKPFYGGTYFPPQRAYNRPGWKEILQLIRSTWQEKQTELVHQAEVLTNHIKNIRFGEGEAVNNDMLGKESLENIALDLLKLADKEWGGFGRAPKFPQTFSLMFLLRQHYFNENKEALSHVLLSIDKMIYGGIYDHLQGGFARYSTDEKWLVPHFEKMLYDNALLIALISEAYQLSKKELYRSVIQQTMQFIKDEWQSPSGGFYSAYDADSEGEEGKYYTWSKNEIEGILGNKSELFCSFYNVTREGNWEGKNILYVKEDLSSFCEQNKLPEQETKILLNNCKQELLNQRKNRIKPLLDNKILLSWNALMITACCKAYGALLEEEYLSMAIRAANFIETHLKEGKNFFHNYKEKANNNAFLDDIAFYIQSLIHLQEVTANQEYLTKAKEYTQMVLDNFSNEEVRLFYYTPQFQKDVIIRKKELHDGAIPSGNSVMAWNLFYLSYIFEDKEWKNRALEMVKTVLATGAKYPTSFSNWHCLLQLFVNGTSEIVIAGPDALKMANQIFTIYYPNRVFQLSNKLINSFPLLRNRWSNKQETLIYVCQNNVCNRPVSTVKEMWKEIRKLRSN